MALFSTCIHYFHYFSVDTCVLETFVAECQDDEVIVIESAMYGRMNMGRCVKGNMVSK